MSYVGIDYGSIAGSNRDPKTGIHYGVISQNSINPESLNDMEIALSSSRRWIFK